MAENIQGKCSLYRVLGKRISKDMKVTFSVSQYLEFHYEGTKPGIVSTRKFIDGFITHNFNFTKPATAITLPDNAQQAYNGKCPINIKKINNVKQLVRYIPEDYVAF